MNRTCVALWMAASAWWTTGVARSEGIALEEFEDAPALAQWELLLGAQASIETRAPYVRSGRGSLKLILPINRNVWDEWNGIANYKLQVTLAPSCISLWVFPVNTIAISLFAWDADGTYADWSIPNLKMGEWNQVTCFVRDAAISPVKENSNRELDDIRGINIGEHKLTTWVGVRDPSKPVVCYIDDLRAVSFDRDVTGESRGSKQPRVDVKAIQGKRRNVESKCAALRKLIAGKKKELGEAAYGRAALAVAERFLRIESPDKVSQKKLTEARVDLDRCSLILEEAIADRKRGKDLKVPVRDMRNITVRGANFRSKDKPLMMLGPVGWSEMWEEIRGVEELGFNVIDDETAGTIGKFQATMQAPGTFGVQDSFFDKERAYPLLNGWKLLVDRGTKLALCFNPERWYVPAWLHQVHPELKPDGTWRGEGFRDYPQESPAIRNLLQKYYQGIIPLTKSSPSLLLYWLTNEPTYWSHTPRYLDLFRQHLHEKYRSVEALNEVWRTGYGDFERVNFPGKENQAAWYDWNEFHFQEVSGFFAWQRSQVKSHAPGALTSNKPIAEHLYMEAFTDAVGIDFEGQAMLYDVPGCDSSVHYSFQNPTGWLVRSGVLLYDFWKSVAPEKPLANLEFHFLEANPPMEYSVDRNETMRYVQSALWQQYLHGIRLLTFWWWRDSKNSGRYSPVTGQPTALYATAKASLDLRRLADHLSLFPPRPEVVVYYSKPSLFLNGPSHMGTLTDVYTGLFFLDNAVGFVTDKMILEGLDKKVRTVVIPEATHVSEEVYRVFVEFAQQGGRLVVVGSSSFGYDATNRQRDTSELNAMRRVRWTETGRSAQEYWRTFHNLLKEDRVRRPIQITDARGQPVWEIESRTVERGGKYVTYLINMSRTPKKVFLKANGPVCRIVDLIAEALVPYSSFVMQPFEVKFLEITQ
ncbi:MAG: beta-galactosidase [Armatimonadetes bacterium]|nr:beta-galactosidase [Armatimonadota bacterium]